MSGTLDQLNHRTFIECPYFSSDFNKYRLDSSLGIFCQDLLGHFGCVNALEFSEDGKYLASAGDDRRILLWDLDRTLISDDKPLVLNALHNSNIFCVAFDSQAQNIYSSGNDEQVIHHDLIKNAAKNVFVYDEAVYGISIDPTNDNLFCVACEDGQILLTDTRTVGDPLRIASYMSAFHSVMYDPIDANYLVTANTKEGVGIWDIRRAGSCYYRYCSRPVDGVSLCAVQGEDCENYATSAKFNRQGTLIMSLRRKSGPQIYDNIIRNWGRHRVKRDHALPLCTFDHDTYYNSCTMKSGCFAGQNDEYVVSGSDDFNVYAWKIPDCSMVEHAIENDIAQDTEPHLILTGHRSIVNQVRYEPIRNLIVSSGVEKMIKVWSPNPVGLKDKNLLRHGPNARSTRPRLDKLPSKDVTISPLHENSALSHDTGISTSFSSQEDGVTATIPSTSLDVSEIGVSNPEREPLASENETTDIETVNIFRNVILRAHALLSYDFAEHNVNEDAGMLSFFDTLLQRELNGNESGWESDVLEDQELRSYDITTSLSPSIATTRTTTSTSLTASPGATNSKNSSSTSSSPIQHKISPTRNVLRSRPSVQNLNTPLGLIDNSSDSDDGVTSDPNPINRKRCGSTGDRPGSLVRLPLKKRLKIDLSNSPPEHYCNSRKKREKEDLVAFYRRYYTSFEVRNDDKTKPAAALQLESSKGTDSHSRSSRGRLLRLIREKKHKNTLIKRRRAQVKVRERGREVLDGGLGMRISFSMTCGEGLNSSNPPLPSSQSSRDNFFLRVNDEIVDTTNGFKKGSPGTTSTTKPVKVSDHAPQNAQAIREKIRRLAALKRETCSSRENCTFETDSKVIASTSPKQDSP